MDTTLETQYLKQYNEYTWLVEDLCEQRNIIREEVDNMNFYEEITTELIAILTTHFPSIESNYFIESGQSLEKYLLLLQSVNRAVGSEELIAPEPNLFGAIYSLATYYELIQGFADFALEQFKHIDETFEEKLKEFSTAKEGLVNG